jgi:hypothetical protein
MSRNKGKLAIILIAGLSMVSCDSVLAIDGMISYWRLDEGSGSTAYDAMGVNDGAINGPQWTVGVVRNALAFDGLDDYVVLPDSPSLSPTSALTLESWIRPHDLFTDQHIISTAGPGPSPFGHDYYIRLVDQGLEFRINDVPFFVRDAVTQADEWLHVAATYDQNQGLRIIYLNGTELIRASFSSPINTGHTWTTIGLNARRLAFGDLFRAFNGIIDEVAIYDRALTAAEVQEHYRNGLNGHGYLLDNREKACAAIERALRQKMQMIDQIETTLVDEQTACETLDDLLASKDYAGLAKGDIIAAMQNVRSAVQHQEQAKQALEKSIESLADALHLLGEDAQP